MSVRYVQTNVGGVRTALVLGSSSAPTTLLTMDASLLGPDGVSGIGAIIDRIVALPASSQAAPRYASFFAVSSSAPALTLSNQIARLLVGAGGPDVIAEGPYRTKSLYTLQGYIDSTAADVAAYIEGSEIY